MTRKLATVSEDDLFGEQTNGISIPLDSRRWFAWLDAPENVSFSYALFNPRRGYIDGFVTFRKERRQRGAVYWTAYRRHARRLHKLYLGPSSVLTKAQLVVVAAHFLALIDGPAAPLP